MGLLASSKRAQFRDLTDYQADDPYIYLNGQAAAGRKASTTRRQTSTPRLVRSSTLSTGLDGPGSPQSWAAAYSNGIRVRSSVLQNSRGSSHVELRRLLCDTQPVGRWQEAVRRLLLAYVLPQEAYMALHFLSENMDAAIRAVKDPSNSMGYPCLYIDIKKKPVVFDIDCWKKIMISLHFEITEPEGNRELDLIEVTITKHVGLGALHGLKVFLQSLLDLSWEMLRMVLALTTEESVKFVAVVQDVLSGHAGRKDLSHQHSILQDLHARYPDQLSMLGFTATRVKKKKEVMWHSQSLDALHHLEVALIGLNHNGSGLETYI